MGRLPDPSVAPDLRKVHLIVLTHALQHDPATSVSGLPPRRRVVRVLTPFYRNLQNTLLVYMCILYYDIRPACIAIR